MYRNDSLESEIAGGCESYAVSVRVMRIVVRNDGAVQFAMIFKASARAVVIVKSPRYSVRIYARREAAFATTVPPSRVLSRYFLKVFIRFSRVLKYSM